MLRPYPERSPSLSFSRAQRLAEAPDVYYVTDHYGGNPAALVRLTRVSSDVLRDSLGMAPEFVTSKTETRSRARARRIQQLDD